MVQLGFINLSTLFAGNGAMNVAHDGSEMLVLACCVVELKVFLNLSSCCGVWAYNVLIGAWY
jgi:hypothetical protein